jgi:hypothetical protein
MLLLPEVLIQAQAAVLGTELPLVLVQAVQA